MCFWILKKRLKRLLKAYV